MAEQSWLDQAGRFLQSAGGGAWEGAKSLGQGVIDLGKGGYALATDGAAREQAWNAANQASQAAMNYGAQAVADPAKAFNDAAAGANSLWTAFDEARKAAEASGQGPEFWGNIAGRGGFEVGSALIPVGALAKAGKLPALVKGADAASDVARASKVPVSCVPCARAAALAGFNASRFNDAMRAGRIAEAREMLLPLMKTQQYDKVIQMLDVAVPPDKGFLWSGDVQAAMMEAGARGGQILETTPGGSIVNGWDEAFAGIPWETQRDKFWGPLSEKYASGLRGKVTGFMTADKPLGGYVFQNFEQAAIARNQLAGVDVADPVIMIIPPKTEIMNVVDGVAIPYPRFSP